MKQVTPDYCTQFRCTGSACQDNCCIGWEITIDPISLAKYQQVEGEFGERLRRSIVLEPSPHFLLGEGERCPFLNQDNLCDIFLTLGKSALCEICDRHPRFYRWEQGRTEVGLGLCCEEATRRLLAETAPFSLHETDDGAVSPPEESTSLEWIAVRDAFFAILQNRAYPLFARLRMAIYLAEALQAAWETSEPSAFSGILSSEATRERYAEIVEETKADAAALALQPALAERLLTVFRSLLPNHADWIDRLSALGEHFPAILEQNAIGPALEIAEERFACYILFRYFLDAADDGDLLSKMHLVVAGVLVTHWMTCDSLRMDREGEPVKIFGAVVRRYSQEIEYCEENIERLYAESQENPIFTPKALWILCQ